MARIFKEEVIIQDEDGREVMKLDPPIAGLSVGTQGNEGDIRVFDGAGRQVFHFDGRLAALWIGAQGNEGDIIVFDGAGREVFRFDSNNANLFIGSQGNEGDLRIRDGAGREVFRFNSDAAVLNLGDKGNEGDLRIRNANGDVSIALDGNTGDIRLSGADCAEDFEVSDSTLIEPGTVMVVNPEGKLEPSSKAYDKKVAGVVSGAGGNQPGIVLGKYQESRGMRLPIALMGKVYCKVEAVQVAVEVGDLLTSSAIPGHAMKAVDANKAFGSVIGKALRPMEGGTGLIPVLVALQ